MELASASRFQSREFKAFLLGTLNGAAVTLPPRFQLTGAYALASDKREQKLKQVWTKPGCLTFVGRFCEGEVLVAVRIEFADGTVDLMSFPQPMPTKDTADLEFDLIKFS